MVGNVQYLAYLGYILLYLVISRYIRYISLYPAISGPDIVKYLVQRTEEGRERSERT